MKHKLVRVNDNLVCVRCNGARYWGSGLFHNNSPAAGMGYVIVNEKPVFDCEIAAVAQVLTE